METNPHKPLNTAEQKFNWKNLETRLNAVWVF